MSKLIAKKGTAAMKKCAFCTSWYDPANSVIQPRQGQRDIWEYETGIKKPIHTNNNAILLHFSHLLFIFLPPHTFPFLNTYNIPKAQEFHTDL